MADDIYLANDARKYRNRLKKQRAYTENWREGLVAARLPERDDVAAACLRCVLRAAGRNPEGWETFINSIIVELLRVSPEYNSQGTKVRIGEMVERQMKKEARERERRV